MLDKRRQNEENVFHKERQTDGLINSVSTGREQRMDRPWQHTTRAKGINGVLDGGVMLKL